MKAIDPNPIKWPLKTTEGFLREIVANQDRDSLQHIVANTQNWRLCFDLLPDMVELALRREFTDKKLGRPKKENAQVYFDAIACLASTKKTKRTYTAQWILVMGGVNRRQNLNLPLLKLLVTLLVIINRQYASDV